MELLICLVIVGILTAIAQPNYSSYVIRASRSEAISVLLYGANQQEQYYIDNYQFSNKLSELNIRKTTSTGLYIVTMALAKNKKTFTITAKRTSTAQADQKCTSFSINDLGERKSTGSATKATCWSE